MIEEGMTVRENVHQLVDALPEDRLADALDYLAELKDEDQVEFSRPKQPSKKVWTTSAMAAIRSTLEEYRLDARAVRYRILLSNRAAKDLDRLNRNTQQRVVRRLEELADAPFDPRLSSPPNERWWAAKKPRGGWRRLSFGGRRVHEPRRSDDPAARGQVYQRI